MRDAAHAQRASRLRQEYVEYLERCAPAVPAVPGYWVHVRTLSGQTHHVAAHPEWTILNLKWGELIAYPPLCRLLLSGCLRYQAECISKVKPEVLPPVRKVPHKHAM